jgi:hypothetical protein
MENGVRPRTVLPVRKTVRGQGPGPAVRYSGGALIPGDRGDPVWQRSSTPMAEGTGPAAVVMRMPGTRDYEEGKGGSQWWMSDEVPTGQD